MSEELPLHGYLAPLDFIEELSHEIKTPVAVHDRLFLSPPLAQNPAWAQDIWQQVYQIKIESISQGVKALKKLGKYWSLYSVAHHRRAALIQEQLPKVKTKKITFPDEPDWLSVGTWLLIDANTILASPRCLKKFPQGEIYFEENKIFPPTRAYLKLWEFFTLNATRPKKGDLCLDLGASPGGWTWVLQSLGADVIAIDKAPLVSKMRKLPRVTCFTESAFALDPKRFGKIDWLCSDVICYPERLYTLVNRWLDAGTVKNMVCTIKLQGKTDFAIIEKFQKIPNATVQHLFHNKHELMFSTLSAPHESA